jgi:hypothetical protein
MISPRQKRALSATLALVAGLLLRLWFIHHAARIEGDTLIYGNIAKNLLQHGVYGFVQTPHGPAPTLIRLPGYPLFLALCFSILGVDRYFAVMHVQCVIDLFTCVLIAALARRLFGPRAALFALWLGALCPFTSAYVGAPLTETLTLATIAIAFYSLERWRSSINPTPSSTQEREVSLEPAPSSPERRSPTASPFNCWLWITAAALAYSILLRPEQGLLAAAILPAMLWMLLDTRSSSPTAKQPLLKTIAPVALAALCVLLPLAPWTLRNWRTFHVLQPLAPRYATDPGEAVPLGFQRWFRTWGIDYASTQLVYWNYDSAEIDLSDLPARAFDNHDQYLRTRALLDEYNQTYNASPRLDAGFAALARERIQSHPLRYYVALPIARLFNMAFRPRAEMLPIPLDWANWKDHRRDTAISAGYGLINIVYFALAAVGLWLWKQTHWVPSAPLAWASIVFVLLRCALLLTIDNSETRYTLELFPVLTLWASRILSHSTDSPVAR